ncbi:MAG TPA: NB-ARC domain-containing protein [Streptosporangiaceae bacterium]
MVRKIVLGGAAAAAGVACVFLIVVMVRQGVDRSGVWAGPLAALAGIVAAVAAVWGPVARSAKVPVPPELEVPDWVVSRPVEVAAVVQALTDGQAGTVGITTGLYGAGGFGKTMLARMVCADRRVRRWFGRRVYLVTVGRDVRGSAAVAAKVNDVIKLVTGEDATFTDPQLAGMRLGALLDAGPRRLLVLDDVWEVEQLAPFAGGGKRCTRLVTTRVPELLAGRGAAVRVDQMSPEQARALLTAGLPTLDEAVTQGLLTATGRWPLLLRLVNTILADYERVAADMPAQAAKLLKRLREAGPAVVDDLRGSPVRGLDVDKPQERAQAVRATIAASTSLLGPDDAERFAELGVFAEDEIIPLRLAARLWQATAGLDDLAASQTYGRLAQLALVTYAAGPARGITVHDVIRDFLRAELGPQRLADLNGTLLDAVGRDLPAASPRDPALPASGVAWWELGQEDRYLWDHLMEHMRDAGWADVAEAVACDLRWVGARLERFGPAAPAADLIAVGTPRSARMRAALARAAHLLAPTEPVGAVTDILHSRVVDDPDWGPQVQALRDTYRRPRLVNRFLPPDRPHPALRRAIHAGHLRGLKPIAPVAGSTWLVTIGQEGCVRIWDATTGNVRWSVDTGYHVYSTAVAMDGTWLAVTGGGPLIEIRDPATGNLTCAVNTGTPHGVEEMAVAPDATWVATASPRLLRDQVLRIWDLSTGELRHAVDTGHRRGVEQVVVAPDGTWLATLGKTSDGPGQQDLRIWDAVTGTLLCTIGTGHAWDMVVAPDGTWLAVSDTQSPAATGRGTTVLIWDSPTGSLRHVIDTGHRQSIARLAVAPDGTWLATADFNWSANDESGPCVQAWDTATGHRRWAIETAHPYGVGQVAVAPDSAWLATIGRNDSSLGGDPVLRIWDADTGVAQSSIDTGHRRGMEQVVVSPDGTWLGGR